VPRRRSRCPLPPRPPKFGCAASSHGRVRTARLHPTARSRHCSRRGGSRSWPPHREQVVAVLWWHGIGRSTTARRPAMNYAQRAALVRRPFQHCCVAPSDTAEGVGIGARDQSRCRPCRPRVAQPVARSGNEPLHSHRAPSPNHPAATGVSGDGTRNSTAAFSTRLCQLSVTIHRSGGRSSWLRLQPARHGLLCGTCVPPLDHLLRKG
jgi:hypothetical protein